MALILPIVKWSSHFLSPGASKTVCKGYPYLGKERSEHSTLTLRDVDCVRYSSGISVKLYQVRFLM